MVALSAGAAADGGDADLLFWPAGQALYQSVLRQDAFGIDLQFVGLENFRDLFSDAQYLNSFRVTGVFAVGVTAGRGCRSR